jgi:hypothetical protein
MSRSWINTAAALTVALVTTVAVAPARAQGANPPTSPWSGEFGIGLDNSISGNINSGAIGTINNQTVVITRNTYEQVYGTGLNLHFGGGYMLDDNLEVRATFTFQSLDADLTPMGEIGASRLYAQYTDYQTFGLDIGLRRYATVAPKVRLYGEGQIGLGFVDKTDVTLVAPGANLSQKVTDFYDQTTAISLGVVGGALMQLNDRYGAFVQIGLRRMSGMSEVDDLLGTGLDSINDNSARWTFPFSLGVRVRF